MDQARLQAAQAALGSTFRNPELLRLALTHASLSERRDVSNERLEFLGDAVLGLVCCEQIYQAYPTLLEGEMTKIKSLVVSRQVCAEIARAIGLDTCLGVGKGMHGHKLLPQSLAAAALESVVAALYLDSGLERVCAFLRPLLEPYIQRAFASGHQENFKSVLQQVAQQKYGCAPQYVVLDERGPDHSKCFELCVAIGDRRFPSCWGASKKQAEQQAALLALRELGAVRADAEGQIRLNTGGEAAGTTIGVDSSQPEDALSARPAPLAVSPA